MYIGYLVNKEYISDLNGIPKEYRGSRIEGTLLSFEMLIIAMACHFIYRAEDLRHWEHKQQYQWEIQPKRRTTGHTDWTDENDNFGNGGNDNNYDDDDDRISDLPISELSALSVNNAPSSLLGSQCGEFKNRNDKAPLLAMPEDHSLRTWNDSLTDNEHTFGSNYKSLDDIK